ncbi:MAG: cytochrome c biogenesis protein ResB [Pseudomonadota bacterium]
MRVSPPSLPFNWRRIAAPMAHPAVLFWVVPYIMLILFLGTLAQADMGLFAAQRTYFNALIFFVGPLPLPGGALALSLLTLNLFVKFLMFSQWSWRKAGIILSHLGVLLLLSGGIWTTLTAQEGAITLAEGAQTAVAKTYEDVGPVRDIPLSFTLRLDDFRKDIYPGTTVARAYTSHVTVIDGAAEWKAVIGMNQPLRYRGYTLYQSAFEEGPSGQVSIFSVVKNSGRLLPYLATGIVGIGLLLHLLLVVLQGARGRASVLAVAAMLCVTPGAKAASVLDMHDFARLPVQQDGRVMPMAQAARVYYAYFYDVASPSVLPATHWMAATLFNPSQAMIEPLFKVTNKQVRAALDLPDDGQTMYSFVQLMAVLQRNQDMLRALTAPENNDDRPAAQQVVLQLYQKVLIYGEVLRTLTPILPLQLQISPTLASDLKLATDRPLTYLDLKQAEEVIKTRLDALLSRKGIKIDTYSNDEEMLARLANHLQLLEVGGAANGMVRLIPPQWQRDGDNWSAPWQLLMTGSGSPDAASYLSSWEDMANAFAIQDGPAWQRAALAARDSITPMLADPYKPARLEAEMWYNTLPVWPLIAAIYLFSALCVVFSTWMPRLTSAAVWLFALAMNAHIAAILTRMFILWRPPVATLYETLLFSALITVFLGAFTMRRAPVLRLPVMAVVSIAAGLLLAISPYFVDVGKGFQPLVAVLNTSFWLGTHVVIITAGYGACLLTAMLAHLALLQPCIPALRDRLMGLDRWLHIAALMSLLFITVGTVLGGVWADQSWGRFWGWDPKENGALLIMLWLVWLLHGRLSGHVTPVMWRAGLAGLTIIQALAWFGVNLLNVGLHSYGFIAGVAVGLFAFCAAQAMLIVALILFGSRRHHAA